MTRSFLVPVAPVARVVAFAAVHGLCRVAHADKLTDAEDLFRRAKTLMGQNQAAEACRLFEASQKLDPQMGTLLNLALCHEQIGRIATAWGEFRAVEQQAASANREDRRRLARDHADKLEPRVSRVKVVVSPEAAVPGLTITVDGETKAEALWSGIAVDPGTRRIEIFAPGKQPKLEMLEIGTLGGQKTLIVPLLEDAPLTPEQEVEARASARRKVGLITGGVGAFVTLTGGIVGVLAVVSDRDAYRACSASCVPGSREAETSNQMTDRALVFANVANVAIPLGIAAMAIGGYFVVTGRSSLPSRAARVYPGLGGVTVVW
jgi:hypothetical protein